MNKPIKIRTKKTLPFEELSPEEFETLCLWLVEFEGYLHVQHFGKAGKDQGRDIVAYKHTFNGEQLWYFQCKRYKRISTASFIAEVDKYNSLVAKDPNKKPFGIVFITSAPISASIRDKVENYCQQYNYSCEFWARTELDRRVKKHPEIVEEFFYTAREICNFICFDLITNRFLKRYSNDNSRSFFYDGTSPTWSDIVHQRDIPRDILNKIIERIEHRNEGRLLVPILAEAGEGKSTFLRRLSVELVSRSKVVLYHRRDSLTVNIKEVCSVTPPPNQSVYILIDDAARIHNFAGFIESLAEVPFPIVVIAASRTYEWTPFRSVYRSNLEVQLGDNNVEWSLDGLTDHEIELLLRQLVYVGLINTLSEPEIRSAINIYGERSKRKTLILILELTKGKRAIEVIRDEIERIREIDERLYTAYRYICLLGSVHSFITLSMLEKLITVDNVELDIIRRLPGLIELTGDRIYVRHDRIGEIATDIFFDAADEERGNLLCKLLSLAFKMRQIAVVDSMRSTISRSIPRSQLFKVMNQIVDEAFCSGEFTLIESALDSFETDFENHVVFEDLLAAKTPRILERIIFPSLKLANLMNWNKIRSAYSGHFLGPVCSNYIGNELKPVGSLETGLRWAKIFEGAIKRGDWQSRHKEFFSKVVHALYKALSTVYKEQAAEAQFQYAEFLRETWHNQAAIPLYMRVLKEKPEYAEAHAGLSLSLYLTENYEIALHHYKKARELNLKVIFNQGYDDLFKDLLKKFGEWEELIELMKFSASDSFNMKKGIQASDIGKAILLDLRLLKNPSEREQGLLRYFYSDLIKEESELVKHIHMLDKLLWHVKTLSVAEQDELGKRMFKMQWFGELRKNNKRATKESRAT